jgi:ZIP family zinc transporter
VSTGELLALGAIAGATIFLGLPMGRMRRPRPALQAFLNAAAIGILTFLLYDVLAHAVEPVNGALTRAHSGHGSWWRFTGLVSTFTVALGVGLLSLVYFDRWRSRRVAVNAPGSASGVEADIETLEGAEEATVPTRPFGPGAAAVEELSPDRAGHHLSPAARLAVLIATGIGLHNFSEGLAIGQSAAKGEISLAVLLVIGFGLHNSTEGFGIVAPLATEAVRPSWRFLLTLGLIGGGPTFLGTVVGQAWVNTGVSIAFLALAAGSILYVVVQLLWVAQKMGFRELLMWGLLLGVLAGFATDFVITAAGL